MVAVISKKLDLDNLQSTYQNAQWRGFVFRDLVIEELKTKRKQSSDRLTTLDIGCGHGFDGHPDPQVLIGNACDELVGIEPDTEIKVPSHFNVVHYSTFENAPIAPNSVDVAYAVMVLEHLDDPQAFLKKLLETLKPGGVFWGFTVDSRHWFSSASNFLKALGLKGSYLTFLHGARGESRYENYPVHYQFNTPERVEALTGQFSYCDVASLWKPNQTSFYFPRGLRWIGNALDLVYRQFGRGGSVLVVRLEK